MSNHNLSSNPATLGALAAGAGAQVATAAGSLSPIVTRLRTNGGHNHRVHRPEAHMFQDTARTILPIEFQGREVHLEAHAYEDDTASYQAMALVHRMPNGHANGNGAVNGKSEAPLVRVHSGCVTGDIFHSLRCDCYQQLQKALERVTTSHHGVIIYLPYHEGRGIGLVNKIKAYAEQDRGLDTVDANLSIGAPVDARDYELAAKILKDLGCTEIRLMTNNPLKVEALKKLGITVTEQVSHVVSASRHNRATSRPSASAWPTSFRAFCRSDISDAARPRPWAASRFLEGVSTAGPAERLSSDARPVRRLET